MEVKCSSTEGRDTVGFESEGETDRDVEKGWVTRDRWRAISGCGGKGEVSLVERAECNCRRLHAHEKYVYNKHGRQCCR